MNYIYDIYLNLNEILYDFFDWNKNDKLIHIKKIPIFKINEETLKLLIQNKVIIDENLLLQIYNKTEIWNKCDKISYCALFSDNNTALAIEFNKNGNSIKKSFLYIDEELEILEIINKLKEKNIDFNILNKEKIFLKTRKQLKEEKFIDNELKNIEDNKLNYIYFECFGKYEKNKKIILENINKISKNSKTYKNLYDILKLTSKANK
ncbi:MAG: DUF3603 family protein [Firmicutes bacterium]|nr:DUF3603 family protein [Bacillota bacterium]